MNFRLVWPITMLKRLEEQYHRAREAGLGTTFSLAVHCVEQLLAADPFSCGESRGENIRLVVESPIAVWFEADDGLKAVTIHDVRYYPPRAG